MKSNRGEYRRAYGNTIGYGQKVTDNFVHESGPTHAHSGLVSAPRSDAGNLNCENGGFAGDRALFAPWFRDSGTTGCVAGTASSSDVPSRSTPPRSGNNDPWRPRAAAWEIRRNGDAIRPIAGLPGFGRKLRQLGSARPCTPSRRVRKLFIERKHLSHVSIHSHSVDNLSGGSPHFLS